MPEPKPKGLRQYAPVKFGEPFNPKSVEGVQMRRRQPLRSAGVKRKKLSWLQSMRVKLRRTPVVRLDLRSENCGTASSSEC